MSQLFLTFSSFSASCVFWDLSGRSCCCFYALLWCILVDLSVMTCLCNSHQGHGARLVQIPLTMKTAAKILQQSLYHHFFFHVWTLYCILWFLNIFLLAAPILFSAFTLQSSWNWFKQLQKDFFCLENLWSLNFYCLHFPAVFLVLFAPGHESSKSPFSC